jgi:multicomponent Na+:H+ antiporter subunit E
MGQAMRLASIALAMFVYWLLLSGHTEPWLLASGAVVAVAVALFGLRMGYADEEGHPVGLIPRGLVYWPWLVKEIVISALHVARLVLDPKLPITPTLIRVKATQKTSTGLVSYANSITLTPGTISVELHARDKEILVHAISAAAAEGLASGEMDRRVTWFEQGRA